MKDEHSVLLARSPFLVILREGVGSTSGTWVTEPRTWDLIIDHHGTGPLPAHVNSAISYTSSGGHKYPSIRRLILANEELIRSYRYVLLPDDDIVCSARDIDLLFEFSSLYSVALSQPSLSTHSFVSRALTLHCPSFLLRFTNWIEAMIPCFRTDFLFKCLDTFKNSETGWGLDNVWSQRAMAAGERIAIIDAIEVTHTRAFRSSRDPHHMQTGFRELDQMVKQYSVYEPLLKVLGAINIAGVNLPTTEIDTHVELQFPPW